MSETFINKYRPRNWIDVIGQKEVVRSLHKAITERAAQTFLLAGPSGTGKTTLARIAAHEIGADGADLIEINAARDTGVDAMRAVQDLIRHRPFTGGRRALLVDEAHRLSGAAWDTILKDTEEPPDFAYWFFLTTNPSKVPKTIRTRSSAYNLQLVSEAELGKLVQWVCKQEDIKLASGVLDLIVRQAQGSPRQALSNLAIAYGAANQTEAARLLEAVLETDAVIDLCRALASGNSNLMKVQALLQNLQDENPEAVRIVVTAYFTKAFLNATTERQAKLYLNVLDYFEHPYAERDGLAPLILSAARVLIPG
jgi:DNA polymerase-3 subunit gamma/tau